MRPPSLAPDAMLTLQADDLLRMGNISNSVCKLPVKHQLEFNEDLPETIKLSVLRTGHATESAFLHAVLQSHTNPTLSAAA